VPDDVLAHRASVHPRHHAPANELPFFSYRGEDGRVAFVAEVDACWAESLAAALGRVRADGDGEALVDLARSSFLDAAARGALAGLARGSTAAANVSSSSVPPRSCPGARTWRRRRRSRSCCAPPDTAT
jgi:hypothetical protein